ncbi:MAG: SH3 domain-containing protein [Gallionella sp.]|nr:MAG: SH3 domain-containing protein [Gallionella sp.]
MSTTRCCCIWLAALLLAMPIAHAGENGVTIKADELKAEPFRDAKTVGALAAGDKVEILKKDGGWLQIKSAKGNGWVRMLSVRRGGARKTAAGGELAGLAGLASGRAGTGRVVATTGIRGLDEEELKAAKYDETELKLAESYSTSRAAAQKFAAKGKLVARSMDYLPDTGEAR